MHVVINLNNDTGDDLYSVISPESSFDAWIDSFASLKDAQLFIAEKNFKFNPETDIVDTRRLLSECCY